VVSNARPLLESGHSYASSVVLQSFVICPNPKLAAALESFCGDCSVFILRKCETYPAPEQLARLIRIHAPNVVFISLQDPGTATELVHTIRTEAPGMAIVAVNESCDADVLLHAVRLGVQDFMSVPRRPAPGSASIEYVRDFRVRLPSLAQPIGSTASYRRSPGLEVLLWL
jgi:DNA-binding NarL/FixJ family response regulator